MHLKHLYFGENVSNESLSIVSSLFELDDINNFQKNEIHNSIYNLGYLSIFHFQAVLFQKREEIVKKPTIIDKISLYRNFNYLENRAFLPNEKGESNAEYFLSIKEDLDTYMNDFEMIGFK